MSDVYMTVDDRRLLRAVKGGHICLTDGGLIVQRGGHRHGRCDTAVQKAIKAGWVHEEPDVKSVYRLTPQGELDLAAREAPFTVSEVAS